MDDKQGDSRGGLDKSVFDRITNLFNDTINTFMKIIQGGKKDEQERISALREINILISIIKNNPQGNISFLISAVRDLIEKFNLKDMLAQLNSAIENYEAANKLITSPANQGLTPVDGINSTEELNKLFKSERILKKYREQKVVSALFSVVEQKEDSKENEAAMRGVVDKRNQAGGIKGLFEAAGNLLSNINTEINIVKNKISEIKEHKKVHGTPHPEEKGLESLEKRLVGMEKAKKDIREECKDNLINFVKLEYILQTVDKPFEKLSYEEVHTKRHAFNNLELKPSVLSLIDQNCTKAELGIINDNDINDILGLNDKTLKSSEPKKPSENIKVEVNSVPDNKWQKVINKSREISEQNLNSR